MPKMIILQCRAELLRIFRNPSYVFWSMAMPILFYLVYTRLVKVQTSMADWKTFFLMSMTSFSVMGSAIMNYGIRIVQEKRSGWTAHMSITPLPAGVYFIGKMVGQTALHLCIVLVLFAVGFGVSGVRLSAWQWGLSGLWILLGSTPFLALGSLFGTMKRVDTASGVSNVVNLILAILGGLWLPLETFPKGMQAVGRLLPSYQYGKGVWEIGRGHVPPLGSIWILLVYLGIFMVLSTYIRKKQEAS
ncbi:ABC transporter permease [Gorillibacterium massiliense]|uniref:ABC transporter permease n=1 Tax=Gorillibacterium massiliense TaxID=1280390 RepID=UPI0004B78BD7|nr:ABC transporter permease [Gorillibacterium massiliense]